MAQLHFDGPKHGIYVRYFPPRRLDSKRVCALLGLRVGFGGFLLREGVFFYILSREEGKRRIDIIRMIGSLSLFYFYVNNILLKGHHYGRPRRALLRLIGAVKGQCVLATNNEWFLQLSLSVYFFSMSENYIFIALFRTSPYFILLKKVLYNISVIKGRDIDILKTHFAIGCQVCTSRFSGVSRFLFSRKTISAALFGDIKGFAVGS